jgi:hypothetical protein
MDKASSKKITSPCFIDDFRYADGREVNVFNAMGDAGTMFAFSDDPGDVFMTRKTLLSS